MLDEKDLQLITSIFKTTLEETLEEKLEEKLEQKLEPIRADIRDLKADVAVLKEDVAVLKEEVAVLKTEVAQLRTEVDQLKLAYASLEARVDVLSSDVAALRTEVTSLRDDFDALKVRVEEIGRIADKANETSISTQISVEHTISKCLTALVDGYKMNSDVLKTKNFDAIEHDSKVAMLTAELIAKSINEYKEAMAEIKKNTDLLMEHYLKQHAA